MRGARSAITCVGVLAVWGMLASPAPGATTVSAHDDAPAAAPASAETHPALAAGATYVGQETCVTCHDTVEAGLAPTPHGSDAFQGMTPHGCETCHGPGSLHVEDPDVVENQPRVERMTPEQQSATCRTCHDNRSQFFWEGSRHAKRGLSCMECHSVHSPQSAEGQLHLATDAEQCATCHKDVRADTWKNSHHPIREGEITCADCHNPHGSAAEKMVRAESINELCYSCHTEKRGPFLWEHPPVRENCMNCHVPHGSNHVKLQRTTVPYLCQQCHANTRHPGTLYDGSRTSTLENPATGSNRVFNRACSDCHNLIHGSNHPSGPYLGH